MIELSVVIPAFNEESIIVSTIQKVCGYLEGRRSYEVLIVDDGSTDRTAAEVESLQATLPRVHLLRNEENRGKGYSVAYGVLQSQGEYVLYTDADLVYPIEGVEPFLSKLKAGFDMAIGSRVHPDSLYALHARHFRYIYQRHLVGRTYIAIAKRLLGLTVADTQCGFKCLTCEAGQAVFSRVRQTSFAFDVEAILIAHRLRLRIAEMPVYYLYLGEDSSVRMARDSLRMLVALLQIRRNDRQGRYA